MQVLGYEFIAGVASGRAFGYSPALVAAAHSSLNHL